MVEHVYINKRDTNKVCQPVIWQRLLGPLLQACDKPLPHPGHLIARWFSG